MMIALLYLIDFIQSGKSFLLCNKKESYKLSQKWLGFSLSGLP